MRRPLAQVLTTLLGLPVLGGCIALPSDVPTNARIGCTTAADCPQGWICRELIGECRSPTNLDETPPELVDVELSPTLALRGTEIALSFAVSEPLFTPPTVSLDGRAFAPGLGGDAGTSAVGADGRFHFTYVADGQEPQGMPVDVRVALVDRNGVDDEPTAGAVSFDFDDPTVTSAIALEPDDGWLAANETLRISFSLSEELPPEMAPVVTLTTSAGDALVPALESNNGSSYVYAYTPVGDEAEVTYGVAIDLEDAAGNTSQADGPRVTFDFTPPAVDNVFLRYTPDANNPIPSTFLAAAKSGTGISLRITATEPLNEDDAQVGVLELTGVLPTPTFGPRQPLSTLAPPPIMNGPPGITAAAEDDRLLIEGTFNDASPTGLYFLEVVWSDLAGNTVTLTLEDPDVVAPGERAVPILVRNDPPQLTVDQSLVRVVFAPWGTRPPTNDDEEEGGPDDVRELLGVDMVQTNGGGMQPWEVRLPAGPHVALTPDDPLAVQAGIDASAFTFTPRAGDLLALYAADPVVQLVVYVDDSGPEVGRVGRLNYFPGVSDERWLRTELPLLPFERLYVTGIDLAGNESQRVPLEQAQWVAHPGQSAFFGEQAFAAFSARATAAVEPRLDESTLLSEPPDPSADRVWDAAVPDAQLGAAFREIPTLPASPLPRFGGSVAYDALRGEIVMFGSEAVGTDTADTWVFDGRVWDDVTPDGPSPSPRVFPGLAFDAVRGRTLMFGGTVLGTVNPDDLWEWDGASWSQRYLDPDAPQPAGRFGHSLVFDPVGERMLLLGGANFGEATGCGSAGGQAFFCDLWAWDGASWSQLTTSGDDPGPRAFAGAAVDQARGVLVLWRGDPAATDNPLLDVNDTWELDLSTLTWTRFDLPDGGDPIAPVNPAFFHPGLGRVAALAARTPALGDPRWELITWNGATWVSSVVAPTEGQPALGRLQSMVSYLPTDDRVFIASGFPAEGDPPLGDDHLTFLVDADGWEVRDPTPGDVYAARNLASLSWDVQRGVAVLTGGGEVVPGGLITEAPLPDDLFELVGDRWVQRPVAPGTRVGGASAYVPAIEEVMIFGGIDSVTPMPGGQAALTYTDETLSWDGATVTTATPTSSPESRYGQAAATAPMGGALLFGGYDGTVTYNDLWAFNGTDWMSIAVAGPSPSPRVNAAMVLDETRGEVLLMGGYVQGTTGFEPSDETWVFDGTGWEQRNAPGPSARAFHAMAFDVERQRPILFGGLGGTFVDDLWEWDGDAWLPVNATVPPLYRMGHGLVYDRERGRLITAAGMSQNFIFQSTTFERASPSLEDVPAMTFVAPATLTSFARESITAVTVRARCSGVFDDGGAEGFGAELFVWDAAAAEPGTGSWRPVASSGSGPGEPLELMTVTEEGAAARRLFLERDRGLALQCRPAGPSGEVVGRVASSFAEIRVDYDLP